MAQRRMFSLKIVDTDEFLDMSPTTQNLYFHLCMRADDDGFVSSPKKIMKIVNSANDDMKVLITKKFVIPFDSGVCVIKHWKIHNFIRKDRYIETEYRYEKKLLTEQDNKYNLSSNKSMVDQITTNGQPNDGIGKVRLGKVRLIKDNKKTTSKDVGKQVSYGNLDINNLIDYFKEQLGGSLDGTIKENRRYAYLLLNRFKKDYPNKSNVDLVKFLIKAGLQDNFHGKNLTSFAYLYRNAQKIIQNIKGQIKNPKYIKL